MDEPNATSVSAQPAEVAERSERRPQGLEVTLRVTTSHSANFLIGVVLQKLNAVTGVVVDDIDVHRAAHSLASYSRPRGSP
jgi:hypothetical protein